MGLIRAVAVILAGCHLSVTAATAQDLCPDGPFQTDVRAIAAAMSSHPLRPAWDASAEFIKGPDRLTDGIYSYGAGGLMNPGGRSLSYDWKRYVNLYLLLNPGSLQHPSIDILKRAPSGGMTRLPVSIGWWSPYPDTFALDGQGHVWVPVPDASEPKAWLYEVESDGVPNYVDGSKPPPAPALTQIHQLIDSIAIATNNAHLYAMRGSDIFEITTPGTRIPRNAGIAPDDVVTSIANISQWAKTRWFSHRPASHIAAASDGALFISDPESDTIFKVSPEKIVTVFAGIPGKSGATDGPGDSARFNSPKGLALDRQGNLYVADSGNRTIRRITPDGLVSTVVGNPGKRGTVDGQGKVVRLDRPASIAIDSTGALYVTNGVDNLIRKISPAGVVSTLNAEGWFDPP